jgi:hypothetical protein
LPPGRTRRAWKSLRDSHNRRPTTTKRIALQDYQVC